MALPANQTSDRNEVIWLPEGLHWYPTDPEVCPPTYYTILQGVCAPLIIIISTVLNSLIGVVLLQKQLRSPTNILLLAIALYDTLTGLFPFPSYIYVFTFQKCGDYFPYNYGWFHRINYEILPFMFHTCSIWVTVVLAIQRYIYVCHSEKAKRWCTVPNALKAIACVNILAFIVAIPMFPEGTFHPVVVRSRKDPQQIFSACAVRDHSEVYKTLFSVYIVLRALLINIGPCTVLVILNAILVERMKEAKQNRERLIKKRSHETRVQEQTSVTLMLVIVVTIFLIVEIPVALHLIISGLLRQFYKINDYNQSLAFVDQFLNFAVLLSYPINFFIYCRMSRAFRDAFTKLLCPAINSSGQEHLPSAPTQFYNKTNHMPENSHIELNDINVVTNSSPKETRPSATVILNSTTTETALSLSPSISRYGHADEKKSSVGSLSKQRVLFRDDLNRSSNTKSTDL